MSKASGDLAEDRAAAWLQRKGLRVIERNWRCRAGEIDLVLRDGAVIVIAEVRLRTGGRYGGAAESIDRRKRAHLIAAAQLYLLRHPNSCCRFDAVLMSGKDGENIEWIRNAFEV
jgi:putative endonuclease